jgi:hypothetical protein
MKIAAMTVAATLGVVACSPTVAEDGAASASGVTTGASGAGSGAGSGVH